jgi:hypothetical protein
LTYAPDADEKKESLKSMPEKLGTGALFVIGVFAIYISMRYYPIRISENLGFDAVMLPADATAVISKLFAEDVGTK